MRIFKLSLALTVFVFLPGSTILAENLEFEGRPTRVIDGDTVKIETSIRLAEIDCPESKQEGGPEARAALTKALNQKGINIFTKSTGRYRRIIGYLRSGAGEIINEQLVREGYCWVYPTSKDSRLKILQEQAKKKKIGIWAGEPEAPWVWRKNRRRK